jgi:hypothetical protein
MLGDTIALPNVYQSLKLIGSNYEKRIKEIKSSFTDVNICNAKITEFNSFVSKKINEKKNDIQNPFKSLKLAIKNYSLNPQDEPIDLEPTFSPLSNKISNISRRFNNIGSA